MTTRNELHNRPGCYKIMENEVVAMNRLRILYLIDRHDRRIFLPWGEDVLSAIGDKHEVHIYDFSRPAGEQLKDVDVVIDHGGSFATREIIDSMNGVRLWCVAGTGLDHVDVDRLKLRGIPVVHCPGQFSSIALAECAMMFILMLTRQFSSCTRNFASRNLYQPIGSELVGRKIAIVGFGSSGIELARRAKAFQMSVMGIDVRDVDRAVIDEIEPVFMGDPQDLDLVISECDILSLHLHLNASTRHIVDRRRLGLMKKSALLINVARGALVDEDALFDALLNGKLGGAGLDVFSREPQDPTHPVFSLPNVIATPHISGCTDGTSKKRAICIAENINRVSQGLKPNYRVDL